MSMCLARRTRAGDRQPNRPDPVTILEEQSKTREPDLVPVRYGRMMASPLTFYRGTAKIMASDLKGTNPDAGLNVQLCGDAHLSNFGVFASPERRLVFDLNDFDETLPGPFEYDVKRMAASFTVAARTNGFSKSDTRASTLASVSGLSRGHVRLRRHVDDGGLVRPPGGRDPVPGRHGQGRCGKQVAQAASTKKARPTSRRRQSRRQRRAATRARKAGAKARTRDSLQALSKLGEVVDGHPRIASRPPIVIPVRDLAATYGITPRRISIR